VNVISSAPSRIEGNRYRLAGILAAIGIAAAAVAGGLFATLGSDGNSTSAAQATHTSVLQSLTPQERRHVEAITSLTPAQLAAGFGTGHERSVLDSLPPLQRRNVEAIAGLTPAQLAAGAGGLATPTVGNVIPDDRPFSRATSSQTNVTPDDRPFSRATSSQTNVTPDDRPFARATSSQAAQAQPDASRIPLSQGELPSGARHGLSVEAPAQSTPPQITTGGALAN
jgi:hypothetical protein